MLAPMLLLMLALQQSDDVVVAPEEDAIVVRAKKEKCRVSVADRIVADPEFQRHAAEWRAGKPVRVVVPASWDYGCLARIMFRLNDHGVTHAAFVDAQ